MKPRLAKLLGALYVWLALGVGVVAWATPIPPAMLDGGQYNSGGITLQAGQDGQLIGLQVDTNGFLRVNVSAGGGAGGTSSSFGSAFPGTGTAAGFPTLTGVMSSPQIDAAGELRVNCSTGCAGGVFNNNADAVATSATNGQAAAWLYGFNGSTWDRLRDDANKNLNINVQDIGSNAVAVGIGASNNGTQRFAISSDSVVAATQSGTWNINTLTTGSTLGFGTVTGGSTQTSVASGANVALQLDTSGWLRVELMSGSSGGGGASSTYGAAFPSTGTAVGFLAGSGGTMSTGQLDVGGNLKVSVATALPPGANQIGSVSQQGTWTVQPGNTANIQPWLVNVVNGVTQGTSPWVTSITTGSAVAMGNVTGGTTQTSIASGSNAALQLDTSGWLRVEIMSQQSAAGGTSSNFGAAFPSAGTAAGVRDNSGLMSSGMLDKNGLLMVNVAAGGGSGGTSSSFGSAFPGTGTAGGFYLNTTGVMTGGTVNASGDLTVKVNEALPAGSNGIGSVTVSSGSSLSYGAVNGTPPSVGNGATNPISLDTAGSLRVTVMSGVMLPYAGPNSAVSGSNSQTSTTQTTLIAAPAAPLRIYVTALQCGNSGSTTSSIALNDGQTWTGVNPAGGGTNVSFPVPLVMSQGTALKFTPGSASTTQYCNAQGYTGL